MVWWLQDTGKNRNGNPTVRQVPASKPPPVFVTVSRILKE